MASGPGAVSTTTGVSAATKKSRPKTVSPTRHGPQQCQVGNYVYVCECGVESLCEVGFYAQYTHHIHSNYILNCIGLVRIMQY